MGPPTRPTSSFNLRPHRKTARQDLPPVNFYDARDLHVMASLLKSMQGYEANHPNIELLRLKNFTIGKKLKDEEVVGPRCLDRIAGLVGIMASFVSCNSPSELV